MNRSGMKRIAIFTTTRADFGIFTSFINHISKSEKLDYCLFVGGTHLAFEHGSTFKEIKNYSYRIEETFDYLLNEDSKYSLARSSGIAMLELAGIFKRSDFDYVCVLGDRFELIPIILNAILFNKPIIHISGGEITEGVIDEQIRHMVTKAAHIHFVSCEEYGLNVKRMGESAWRVFNVGELSIDNLVNNKRLSKKKIFKDLKIDELRETILMTYHPVTLEFNLSPLQQIKSIFQALDKFNYQVVITAPNIEAEREIIVDYIKDQVAKKSSYIYIESLGMKRFHSLMPHCKFVLGNSSSGIAEAPFFKIPTVNVGDRQKGRIKHESIIDTGYEEVSIIHGIEKVDDVDFRKKVQEMKFLFGNGTAAEQMVEIIENLQPGQNILTKKLDFIY